jgi:hypothetical protein
MEEENIIQGAKIARTNDFTNRILINESELLKNFTFIKEIF